MCIIVASKWSGCCIMISILFRCWTARVGKKSIIACACYFTFTLNWQSQVIALCWVIQRGLMAAGWESVGQLRKRWGKSAQPSCDLHHAPALSKPLRIRWANLIIKLAAVLKKKKWIKVWWSWKTGLSRASVPLHAMWSQKKKGKSFRKTTLIKIKLPLVWQNSSSYC